MVLDPRPAFGQVAPLPGYWRFTADRLSWSTYSGLSSPSAVTQLGPVQLAAFSFTQELSGFGDGEAEVLVDGGLPREMLWELYSWRLWAWHHDEPVWCAWPTGLADSGGASVTLSLTEVSGFLHKRKFADTYRATQVEQVLIARRLAAPVQEAGVALTQDGGPGFLRDRSYAYLEGTDRAELLTNLSQVGEFVGGTAGPQFRTQYDLAAGLPRATLHIAWPRVGADTGAGATVPGTATGFQVAWDADKLRTMTFAVGDLAEDAPEGAVKPVSQLWVPQPGSGRPPRLDEADDYPGTILASTLAERAQTASALYAQPVITLDMTVSLDAPKLATYSVGDTVTVHIADPLLGGGLDLSGQLQRREVSAGEGTAHWTVATTLPSPRARETLASSLGRLSSQTQRQWRRLLTTPSTTPDAGGLT
jgi:hypothetical protein